MQKLRSYLKNVLIIGFAICLSCQSAETVDVSGIDLEIDVRHFERDLFALDPDSLQSQYRMLRGVYGDFIDLFPERIIGIGPVETPVFAANMRRFVTDTMILLLDRQVRAAFPDTAALDAAFTDAFRRFHYYFEQNIVPQVFTFISGFNLSVGIDSNAVFIGLDRYLGPEQKYYSMLGIPKYLQQNMIPQKITSDALHAWLLGEFPMNDSVDNVLTNMIWQGELLYICTQLLPNQDVASIIGFTPEQLKFCKNNERMMWTYLVEHKLLFSTNSLDIARFTHDAPFTSGFPQESPGKAAVWLGYRIVDKFMRQNPERTLADLVRIADYSEILSDSKYRP